VLEIADNRAHWNVESHSLKFIISKIIFFCPKKMGHIINKNSPCPYFLFFIVFYYNFFLTFLGHISNKVQAWTAKFKYLIIFFSFFFMLLQQQFYLGQSKKNFFFNGKYVWHCCFEVFLIYLYVYVCFYYLLPFIKENLSSVNKQYMKATMSQSIFY